MNKLETVEIMFSDLEDVRQVLAACAGYFYAEDLQRAQIGFAAVTKSPLTKEIEIIQTRFDGYLGDHLRQRYELEQEEVVEEDDGMPSEILGVEVQPVEEEEPLSSEPLGSALPKKRRGRRVTKEELIERAESEDGV